MKLAGRYEVLLEIARHGLVRVFRVRDTSDNSVLIIKTMPVTSDNMEDFVRFQEEGTVITSLDHPNLWKVYGTFIDEGMSCIILADFEGRTLTDVIRDEELPLWRIKSFALQIASALAYAHERNVIHRDLEPENVFITREDQVKLRAIAELGMARIIRGAAIPARVANTRSSIYASPEQRAGGTVGKQTDIYSLGALMYHMVNRRPPHEDMRYARTLQFRENVPMEWRTLIARAMARSERYRITSAIELGKAIESLPAPGGPSMRFQAPQRPKRCPRCGREGRGTFCSNCGARIEA